MEDDNQDASDASHLVKNALELLNNLKTELRDARKDNQDMSEVIQKIKKDLEGLHGAAKAIYDKTGMSKSEVENYITDPSNFSDDEWKLLNKIKEETEVCKKEIMKSVEKDTINEIIGKKPGQKPKKRRKRWIES